MRERPIIFSGPMVRALLAGTKSQTRRVITPQPDPADVAPHCENGWWMWRRWMKGEPGAPSVRLGDRRCPYGTAGDQLWVRETFTRIPIAEPDGGQGDKMGFAYRADGENAFDAMPEEWDFMGKWTPAIHMPRAACRIFLDVVRVRVERLWDISADDAFAEGIEAMRCPDCHLMAFGLPGWRHGDMQPTPIEAYWHLWDQINEARGYGRSKNPWTWVVEFKRGEM